MITRFRTFVAGQESWFFAIVAIAITPLILGLLTTTFDGYVTYPQSVTRVLSLVTIATDLLIVGVSVKSGLILFLVTSLKKSTKIVLLLVLVIAILAVFTDRNSIAFSIFITCRFLLQFFALMSLVHILTVSQDLQADRYFAVMTIGALLYVAYILAVIAAIPDRASFYWLGGLPSATNVRHIGNYVVVFLAAAAGLFFFAYGRSRWAILAVVFGLTAFMAWTGSRAAFVGLAVALPTAIFMVRRQISAARIGILVATLGFAVLVAIPLPTPGPSFGVIRMITASDMRQASDVSSARTQIWKNTIDEIAAAPVIGHGAGRFLGNMDAKYKYDLDNPHNFILQFAYDWGIAGLVAVLLLLMLGSYRLFTLPIISPVATFCAVSGLMLMLSVGMLEGMFYHPLKMLLASALIAPAFALARQRRAQQAAVC